MIPTRNWCRSLCCNWGSHQQPQQNERSSEVLNILSPAQCSTYQVQKENRLDQRIVNLFFHLKNILFQIREDVDIFFGNSYGEPKEGILDEVCC